jgi:putative flavoprotein involved in K+ transport
VTAAPVVIIGAGPAGLATAYSLAGRGRPYRLLEQGSDPLWSLRRVDPEMALLSPKRLSRLPGQRLPREDPTYLPFRVLVERFEQYLRDHHLVVETGCEVTTVRRRERAFVVEGRREERPFEIEASHVVNATGIIRHPRLPAEFDPRRCTFRFMHSLDFRTADLAAVERLVVVGGGASAAEVLERWLRQGPAVAPAMLSLRSRLWAARSPLLGIDLHYYVWLPEQLRTRWIPDRVANLPEPMNGIHVLPALRAGRIVRRPAVARYEGARVVFADGVQMEPDVVVFATGFRYDVSHLGGLVETDAEGRPLVTDCASRTTPGLYLLGTRFGRTFASPYLRGIARDAAWVAERIAEAA